MSLRALTGDAMLALSRGWLDDEGAGAILAGKPALRALLPKLREARDALLAATGSSPTRSLDALARDAERVDAFHDRKLRGVVGALLALADLTEDEDEARELVGLSQRLFPRGLRGQELAHRDEGREAEEAAAKLDDATRAALARLPTPWGTLADEVDAWIGAGRDLSRLDAARQHAKEVEGTSEARAALARARHRWAQAAEALAAAVAADDELTAAETDTLVGALYKAELAALRRE